MKNLDEIVKLLNHIEEKPASTQRELVEKLDISLGKINFIISALVEKGWVKLKRFKKSKKKKGYMYLLTPKGISEKSRITINFLENGQKVTKNGGLFYFLTYFYDNNTLSPCI